MPCQFNFQLLCLLLMMGLTVPTFAAENPADALLDRIEIQAKKMQTYTADIRFDQIQGLLGDQQTRFGKLYYVVKPTVKFAVHFQRVVIDGKLRKQNRQWIYDGIWLVEKLEDKKQFFKRQIHHHPGSLAPGTSTPGTSTPGTPTPGTPTPGTPTPGTSPGNSGNYTDPMSLQNSPFPIPLQAKKSEVLKRFTVSLITDKTEEDPKKIKTYHLKLTPRPKMGITFTQIDLWYDQTTLLPVKCVTLNADSDDEQIFSLFNPKLNEPINPQYINTSTPTQRGWQVEITPLQTNPLKP